MAYYKKWHDENYPRLKQRKDARRRRNAEIIREARAAGACTHCGEPDVRCLDFHHLDPNQKAFTISTAIARDATPDRLRAEIAKCELLCANCHRKYHGAAFVKGMC